MSKIDNGINGNMRGKCGAVTFYKRGDKYYVRQSIVHNTSKTEGQLKQRGKFQTAIKTFSPLKDAFRVGFAKQAEGARTGFNVGVGYNMLNALVGEKGNYSVDWSLVGCSQGKLPMLCNADIVAATVTSFKVTWTPGLSVEGANGNDNVCLAYYDHETQTAGFLGRGSAARKDGKIKVSVSKELSGHTLEVYIFAVRNKSDEASNTTYVGQITIE